MTNQVPSLQDLASLPLDDTAEIAAIERPSYRLTKPGVEHLCRR